MATRAKTIFLTHPEIVDRFKAFQASLKRDLKIDRKAGGPLAVDLLLKIAEQADKDHPDWVWKLFCEWETPVSGYPNSKHLDPKNWEHYHDD